MTDGKKVPEQSSPACPRCGFFARMEYDKLKDMLKIGYVHKDNEPYSCGAHDCGWTGTHKEVHWRHNE